MSVQNILEFIGKITGGHNKDSKFVAEIFFDPMNELDPEKKILDLHMFDGSSVCRKAQNVLRFVYPMLSCIVGAYHTCHHMFKGCEYIEEITKMCIKYKVC